MNVPNDAYDGMKTPLRAEARSAASGWQTTLVGLLGTSIPRAAAPFFGGVLWRAPVRSKEAYLTFDDGPDPSTTPRILDILERHEARGTFFLLGRKAERHPELVRRIRAAGHAVGNHGFAHLDAWRTPRGEVIGDLERSSSVLERILEEDVRWMRPAYGHLRPSTLRWAAARRQRMVMWDTAPADYLTFMDAPDVARLLMRHLRPGSIVVLHDNVRAAGAAVDALSLVLPELTARQWRFPSLAAEPHASPVLPSR